MIQKRCTKELTEGKVR